MFSSRLDGDRIFGRVYELDLECPQCSEVYHLNSPGRNIMQHPSRHPRWSPGPYNYRTGKFRCPSCESVFAVGLYLYPVDDRHGEDVAEDWTPTYRQGLALRNQTVSYLAPMAVRWKAARNTVIRDGCVCRIRGGTRGKSKWGTPKDMRCRFIINPDCPIHGCLIEELINSGNGAPV
jgi:hypothetical protein